MAKQTRKREDFSQASHRVVKTVAEQSEREGGDAPTPLVYRYREHARRLPDVDAASTEPAPQDTEV